MSRLNVYLPDHLAAAAREAGANVSALTQQAVTGFLAQRSTDAWLARRPHMSGSPVSHESALAALDDVRDEGSTRHG